MDQLEKNKDRYTEKLKIDILVSNSEKTKQLLTLE